MSGRVFIDTNLFIYAHVPDDSEKHEMAVELLDRQISGSQVIISVQVLNEFYSAMSRKYKRTHSEISSLLNNIARISNVAAISFSTIELCLRLKDRYGYSYWDSLILASAAENAYETVYSEDMRHGHIVEGRLIIQNPFVAR